MSMDNHPVMVELPIGATRVTSAVFVSKSNQPIVLGSDCDLDLCNRTYTFPDECPDDRPSENLMQTDSIPSELGIQSKSKLISASAFASTRARGEPPTLS